MRGNVSYSYPFPVPLYSPRPYPQLLPLRYALPRFGASLCATCLAMPSECPRAMWRPAHVGTVEITAQRPPSSFCRMVGKARALRELPRHVEDSGHGPIHALGACEVSERELAADELGAHGMRPVDAHDCRHRGRADAFKVEVVCDYDVPRVPPTMGVDADAVVSPARVGLCVGIEHPVAFDGQGFLADALGESAFRAGCAALP